MLLHVVAAAIRELDFEAAVDGDELRLRGTANGRSAERLQQLIVQTHRAAVDRGTAHFTIDLRRVAAMSDICFNILVWWIGMVQDLPVEQRYRMLFAIDPATSWQRRSVVTLSSMAVDVVKLPS